jgi:MFS family permease
MPLRQGLSSFAVFTLGLQAGTASIYAGLVTVSFILFSVPAGLIGTRYGREGTIRIGLIGMALLTLIGYFIIQSAIDICCYSHSCRFYVGNGQCKQSPAWFMTMVMRNVLELLPVYITFHRNWLLCLGQHLEASW